jgi:transposase
MTTYQLNPTMTFETVAEISSALKPAEPREPRDQVADAIAQTLVPAPKLKSERATLLPPRQPLPTPVIDPQKPMIKLGLDVHLLFIMAVAQRGHATPMPPRKFTPAELCQQIKRWVSEGLQVFCVQESCGFGFLLHRELVEAGAQSFLITPLSLNGKRKTDKVDARALCQRLTRFLEGDDKEVCPIRIPSQEEQNKREVPRRRRFLKSLMRSVANRGHGVAAEFFHIPLPHGWWGPRKWKKLTTSIDPWFKSVLESLREVILNIEAQITRLDAEMIQRVKEQPLPKGLGRLSLVMIDAEICDWARFFNRKQVGSYTGCCPAEYSSGGSRRLGSIDRMGNAHVRTLLVEAVWRFLLWQPGWKAAQKMKLRLKDGAALRKKTAIALARHLAIDLWRWRTGRCTMEELGWVPATSGQE